jgi:hypothetical protein
MVIKHSEQQQKTQTHKFHEAQSFRNQEYEVPGMILLQAYLYAVIAQSV